MNLDPPAGPAFVPVPAQPDTNKGRRHSGEVVNGSISGTSKAAEVSNDRLIIGIDFGTTYSGVAVVYSANPEDIDIIKTWPGGNGISSDKVPTEIAYHSSAAANEAAENGDGGLNSTVAKSAATNIKWGFQFKPEEPRLRCIKLFLDRNQRLPSFVSPVETASQLRKHERTVIDAVSDYLYQLKEHTINTLIRRYGETFMSTTKVHFVLTVPAVWSDAAKMATLQAAEKAGMGTEHHVKLISEPEAAAVYTFKAIQPTQFKVGDNFVVCDAGGGTVDLIAYRITQLSPLQVEESAVGTGGLCGSAFLNYRFEAHVKARLGDQRYNHMRDRKAKTWNMGLKYFEEFVKRNFNENEHHEVNVPLPGLPDDETIGLDSGFLILTSEQVKEIIEPVVQEVVGLVEGQVQSIRQKGEVVSGIILVGGFGQSNYLYNKLKAHFNTEPPPPYTERPTHAAAVVPSRNIEVLQPMYAWTAVVRGAVLRGLEGNMVMKRRSRWHYGTTYATVFDVDKHPASERYYSHLWGRWMVSNRMQWHIEKGAQISDNQPISFHYTRNFRPGQSLVVEDDLLACGDDMAPDSYNKSLINVCTLTTDLSAVPKSLFTRLTTTKGVEFDNLDFTLDMRIESAGLAFELKVDGVRYGGVSVKFRENGWTDGDASLYGSPHGPTFDIAARHGSLASFDTTA